MSEDGKVPRPRRATAACLIVLAALSAASAHADQRADFLAGRTRECPRCDLAGMNFKRRDLTGADLTGANLKNANFHDARLTGARLAGADLTAANLNKANLSPGGAGRRRAARGHALCRQS